MPGAGSTSAGTCSTTGPRTQRTLIGRKLGKAWWQAAAEKAERDLRALASQLQADHPGAAASLREGLEGTLTMARLGLSPSLRPTPRSTNAVESMALRRAAAAVLEAET